MRETAFRGWLERQQIDPGTVSTRLSYVRRVAAAYGDLDRAYDSDGLQAILTELEYSAEDRRLDRPNPSRLDTSGDLYSNLSSARSHLRAYRQFCDNGGTAPSAPEPEAESATLSLERDLERALRADPGQIEPGLRIADGGAQRRVESGFIDILAEDAAGRTVVIELKAVRAGREAVGQILAYMGDMQGGGAVRGLLIAPDFAPAAVSAARMVPGLELRRFSFRFAFESVGHGG